MANKYVRKSLLEIEFNGFRPDKPVLASDFVDKTMSYDENGNVIYHDRDFKEESELKCSDFKLEVILKTAPESLKLISSPYSANKLDASDALETSLRRLDSVQDDAEYRAKVTELLKDSNPEPTPEPTSDPTPTDN